MTSTLNAAGLEIAWNDIDGPSRKGSGAAGGEGEGLMDNMMYGQP